MWVIKRIIRIISVAAATTTIIFIIKLSWTYIINFLLFMLFISIPVIIVKIIGWAWEDDNFDDEEENK